MASELPADLSADLRRTFGERNEVQTVPAERSPGGRLLHADLRLLGEPDRSPLRATTRVRVEQLEPPPPCRSRPSPPCPPALA